MKYTGFSKWRQGNDWGFWFRFLDYGVAVSTLRPMFSERNGYRKYWQFGRVKISLLTR
jgi:hypothetical protein